MQILLSHLAAWSPKRPLDNTGCPKSLTTVFQTVKELLGRSVWVLLITFHCTCLSLTLCRRDSSQRWTSDSPPAHCLLRPAVCYTAVIKYATHCKQVNYGKYFTPPFVSWNQYMTFDSFSRSVCVCVCVCVCVRAKKGYSMLGSEGWRKAVIKMKYSVNYVSKLFARNVCTVLSRCSWLTGPHKTATNIGIHCQFKRLFCSKNLCNISGKNI
jgi:hypothetical protein